MFGLWFALSSTSRHHKSSHHICSAAGSPGRCPFAFSLGECVGTLDELTYPTWGARGKPDDVSCWPNTIFAWHFPVVSRYDTVRLPVFAENLAPRLWQVSINMFKTHTVTYVLPKSTHNILVIQPTIKHNIAWAGMSPEQFLKIKDNSSPYLTPSNVGLPSNVQQNNLFDVNMWHVPKKHHQTSIHVVHVWHVNQ